MHFCYYCITIFLKGAVMQGQLTIRLNDELEQGLESIAHRLNRKRSDIVRLALQKFIGEAEAEAGLAPFDKIQHLAGSVETGVSDLGENHREHLKTRFKRHA
jgi:metal-responsive CopG/Arc/MetJ family transcriptional regulator